MSIKKLPLTVNVPLALWELVDQEARSEMRSRSNIVVKRLCEVYKLSPKLADANKVKHANKT